MYKRQAHPRQEIRLGLAYGIRPGFHHKGRNDFAQLLQKLPLLIVPAISVRLHLKTQNLSLIHISFVRTFGLIITSLLVLPFIIGMDGVWLAIPIAEFGGILLCLYFLRKYRTKYHYA